jgi:FMNH2-dependent dimethyl sulfone monooxygenase
MDREAHQRARRAMHNDNQFKLGLFGPNCSSGRAITLAPERWSGTWEDNVALARMADEAGIDFMLPIARWKGYGGETDYQGREMETVTWATGLLAATKRITVFGTVHAPLFHPVIAAKQFATADHVGNGRFGLNIVCGWNEGEFRMFGATKHEHEARYAQGQEWFDVVRRIWDSEEEFDFDGQFFHMQGVRSRPGPVNGTHPVVMNAGASPTGKAFAVRNCDALFSNPAGGDNFDLFANNVKEAKEMAAQHGRELDVFSVGVITCRPTMQEAKDYHHRCIVEEADWGAVDNILAMKNVSPETVGQEEYERRRAHQAHGMGGLPIIGDPDHVADMLGRMAKAGVRGLGLSFVNYAEELPYFCAEVLPRLEKMGLRQPAPALSPN